MSYRCAFLVVAFTTTALFAQRSTHGVAHATAKRPTPTDSLTVPFPDTPVGATSILDCYYDCFITGGGFCNYSGTIELVKQIGPPFRVINLRKGIANMSGDCSGTPVTLPITLQPGEWLLQDFVFAPTSPGMFQDTHIYNVTPTGSPTTALTWVLVGSTGGPAITSFAAVPPTVRPGQQTTLSWVTSGATAVSFDNGVGPQPLSGSVTVAPTSTTTYTLTASNNVTSSTAKVTVTVLTAPTLVITALPQPILQLANTGGGTSTFTVSNTGGGASTITVSQNGTFFSLSPTSFVLQPGASQAVTISANAVPSGGFNGTAFVNGTGFSTQLAVPVEVFSTAPPAGTVTAKPATNRVDVSQSTTGSVSFTNAGNATLTGVLVADVPWIIPQSGIVTIAPGATSTFTFTIDRSKRAESDIGSSTGALSLVYLSGGAPKVGPLDATPPPSVSLVSVVDTVPLAVGSGSAPPLAAGEVALFVPAVGHVTGSVGTFISDLSVLNPPGNPQINDIRFFYTSRDLSTQKTTSLPSIGNVSVSLADVVKNVFGTDAQVGSLQIRSASADKLLVSANIFNSSNPKGTYGTAIPTFRSDRSVGSGDRVVLTGIRQEVGLAHTNFFIQETAGVGATVQTEFIDVNGATLGTRSDVVGAFALSEIDRAAPAGTVAAILTNSSSGSGRFLAYATPVDDRSGDNWSVVDWSRQYGYSGSDPVVIPVAGVAPGANNTLFRTDVTITNTSSSAATGTLQYFPSDAASTSKQINLGARQSMLLNNVIGTFFGATGRSIGYLLFTPASGSFAITNRTYTTDPTNGGTFGSAAPTLPARGSMKAGSLRAIGSLQDATRATVIAAAPGTFRTNFGLVETSGNSVTVRVTLRFNYPAGGKLQAVGSAFKDYTLAANQFLQLNGIGAEILGSSRETLGDLRGLEVDFQVIGGNGAVAVFTSSVDNGTGDSILRTE